jgi:hypothetical protein
MHFDSIDLTAPSEYATRGGERISVLQIHHATTTSLSGLRALMSPGGRTVSANVAMGSDGHRKLVVPIDKRAYTSATPFDRRSVTVEVCNTSLAPNWGISDGAHEALAHMAAEMHAEFGMSLDRQHIIGHREVPGTYATACPGPSMNLDRIVRRAREIAEGDDMQRYLDWNNDDKVFLAGDVLNKPVIENINGDVVSAAAILNAAERKAGSAEQAAVATAGKIDALEASNRKLTEQLGQVLTALSKR